jgi:hypothetical protein
MSCIIRFRPEIVSDLKDAARWYDGRQSGLGGDFLQKCRRARDRIVEHPEHVAPDATGISFAAPTSVPVRPTLPTGRNEDCCVCDNVRRS